MGCKIQDPVEPDQNPIETGERRFAPGSFEHAQPVVGVTRSRSSQLSFDHQPVLMLEACSASRHDELQRLIQLGHNVDHVWPGRLRLLHIAASRGDVRSVEMLLAAGAEVDAVTAKGETAMYLSAAEGHRLVLIALHRAKACFDIGNHRGNTPLHVSMAGNHHECARQLLWFGARTDCRNVHSLRAEDMIPVMRQPKDLVDLFRAIRIRQRTIKGSDVLA